MLFTYISGNLVQLETNNLFLLVSEFLLFFISDAGSVSDDYLQYMLWQFPTNVTGWICHALVTSSLLKVG